MDRVTALLAELSGRGVMLFRTPHGIGYAAPRGALTSELRAEVAAHRRELLPMLESSTPIRPEECLELIGAELTALAQLHVEGAIQLLETDPELGQRFSATEDAIVNATVIGTTAHTFRTALAAYAAVIEEACLRTRARRDHSATFQSHMGSTTDRLRKRSRGLASGRAGQ